MDALTMAGLFPKDGRLRTFIRPIRGKLKNGVVMTRARRRRRRSSKAVFVAITGSSGKTTTTALIARFLGSAGKVRKQIIHNQINTLARVLATLERDVEYVVQEFGVAKVGDMAPMAELAQPDVAVVTMVGMEHYSSFRGVEGVAKEKGKLLEALSSGGLAILNADDENVMSMAARTDARVVTFGREKEADYRVTAISQTFPDPLRIDIEWAGGKALIAIGFNGEHFWMPVAAAFAAAHALGVPADAIVEACADFETLPGRCSVLRVPDGPIFVLDTVKAPAGTMTLPMDLVEKAEAPRKRVVIGQIADFPGNPVPRYRGAYQAARKFAEQVIMVGDNAHRHRASEEDVAGGHVVETATAREVYEHLRDTAIPGEIILIKSAQFLHLERAALAFTHDVRCWEHQCGQAAGCFSCGLYEVPFEEHRTRKNRRQSQRSRDVYRK